MKKFDWIVIGGGSGGLSVIEMAIKYNKKCLLVDSKPLGGTCVNVGCVPKKMMWFLTEVYEKSRLLNDYEIKTKENLEFSFSNFVKKRQESINNINNWYEDTLKDKVDYIKGHATFESQNTIKIGNDLFWGEKIVISTGSEPYYPKIEGSEHGITSDGFFALTKVPKSICIVGSGYIALEIASLTATLQEIQYQEKDVTILIRSDKTLKNIDEETTAFLQEQMQKKGIKFKFNSSAKHVEKEGKDIKITTNSSETIHTETLLWAIGRSPNSNNINLEKTKIETDNNGYIKTNDYFETNIKDHFALGDVINKPQLTPVAVQCGRRLVRQLYENKEENKVVFDSIPTAVFTHPPLATIGLSKKQAEELNIETEEFTSSFTPMIFNFSPTSPDSFIKMVCEKKTQKVLGIHMVGESVDEILQGFAVAIKMGATKREFDKTFAIHPTSAEEVVTLKPIS